MKNYWLKRVEDNNITAICEHLRELIRSLCLGYRGRATANHELCKVYAFLDMTDLSDQAIDNLIEELENILQ